MRPPLLLSIAAAVAALALDPLAAIAHPDLQPREARVGASYRAVISIPHGCDGSPTVKVRVIIPEGVVGVKPMLKPGWEITTVRGAYARGYPYHGKTLTEGVKEVIWSGRLPDDLFDDFVFSAFVSDSLSAGQMLYFPTYQECENGERRWIEIPALGRDAHALASPAPGVMLVAAAKTAADGTYKLGPLAIEAPWARATPAGAKVGGAYFKITNAGSAPDRLIGGSFPVASAVEVHEAVTTGGMMRMRELATGLEIAPGATLELKPGSYHLMLTGLREPLKEGSSVKGRLMFEKAGAVDIELTVKAMGAQSPGHSHH